MSRIDVVGIGNALVDVSSHEADAFIADHGLEKGAMTLIDTERAETLYASMGPSTEMSGGSAANTMVGIASFGGTSAFIGRVNDDQLGAVFGHDIRAAGVEFATAPAADSEPTGRCLIIVTPDAQRTLNTYLGAAARPQLRRSRRRPPRPVAGAVPGGLPVGRARCQGRLPRGVARAHDAGNRVAFTLSDSFCVDRHRDEFVDLIERDVDVLFANEAEITSLYEVVSFDDALQHVVKQCEIAALTRSEKGAVVVTRDEVHVIDAHPVDHVVDTTGAGDSFAAGFLYGLTHGYDLGTAGRLAALAASDVISHLGGRPQGSLATLAADLLDR